MSCLSTLLFYCSSAIRHLHSFPTRRSSDLYLTGENDNRRKSWSDQSGDEYSRSIAQSFFVTYDLGELGALGDVTDRKSTRLNSSHVAISYAVFCLKKKKKQ